MKTRYTTFLAAAMVASMSYLGWAAPAAQAGLVASRMYLDGQTFNTFVDDNAEYMINNQGKAGVLDVGDIIRGGVNFNSINTQSGPSQLAGVYSLEVKDIQNVHTDTSGTLRGDIIFGPDSGFGTWLSGFAANGPTVTAGTIVRLWENATNTVNFTNPSLLADQNLDSATQGAFFEDWGFTGNVNTVSHFNGGVIVSNNGEGWVVHNGGLAFDDAAGVGLNFLIGTGYFSLSVLQNGGQIGVVPHVNNTINAAIGAALGSTADITGSSSVYGSHNSLYTLAGFPVNSTTQVSVVAVPEPASVWILGCLGALLLLRRRRHQNISKAV